MIKKTMRKTKRELNIFKAFIDTCPNFAGCKVDWVPGNNPPDILCRGDNGQRIGVELGEWLHEKQTERSKAFKALEKEINNYLVYKNIILENVVLMFPGSDSIFPKKTDRKRFIKELFEFLNQKKFLTSKVDKEIYLKIPDIFISLRKYINRIIIYQSVHNHTKIVFSKACSYSPADAVEALFTLLNKKIKKYSKLKEERNLDYLYLVVYYDSAFVLNTPYERANGGIEKIVSDVADHLKNHHGVFDKFFLFLSLSPGRTVFELFSSEIEN